MVYVYIFICDLVTLENDLPHHTWFSHSFPDSWFLAFIRPSQVCILSNPGQEEDVTALVARLAQGTQGDRKNAQPVDGGGETDDSTLTDASSNSSSECKRNTSESAVQNPRKKRRPKKTPRKFMDISWLSDMLSEFQQDVGKPGNQDNQPPKTETETPIGMSSSSSSSSPSNITAVVEDVLKGGFGTSTKSSVLASEADEVEKGEEQDIQDMSNESGLSLMVQRETKLVEDAIGKTARLKSKGQETKGQKETFSEGSIAAIAKSPVVEENLRNSILEFVSAGLDPEDAATEAMLNSSDLLGNEEGVVNVVSSAASAAAATNPDNDPGPVVSGAGKSQRDGLNNDRFSKWQAGCALSIKALQTRSAGMATPLGSELTLIEHEGNVLYIHWKDPEKCLGRPASLDKQFGVKCIVPVGDLKQPRDYSSAHVIWPSIGIQMLRQKGHQAFLRPRVPDPVLRVASIWKQALVCKDARRGLDPLAEYNALIPSDSVCLGCGQGSAILAQNDSVQICPLCLQSFHWTCARELAKYGEESGLSFPDDMELCSLVQPEVFESQTMHPPILGSRLD